MSDWLSVFAIVLLAFAVVGLGWWLLIESEGVYLGRRVVIWLYDVYAGRYDDIKHFRGDYDHQFLAQPMLELIAPHNSPLVLDVATGTARLPLALFKHARFQGKVIGVDLSRRMLSHAAPKFGNEPRITLIHAPAEALPFPNDCFDVVTCLEALEFMTSPEAALTELVRVLRPGGLMLITNRIHTRWMPGKLRTAEGIEQILNRLGIEDVLVDEWQVEYDRVWGRKEGDSLPTGALSTAEVLLCPVCHEELLEQTEQGWMCPRGHFTAPVGMDGVIELMREG
jgi:ubiquinone/menaquinone biosynthesis C-methylase UbiE